MRTGLIRGGGGRDREAVCGKWWGVLSFLFGGQTAHQATIAQCKSFSKVIIERC